MHVPLTVRYARLYPESKRVVTPISTRRIFHAVLESAGIHPTRHRAREVGGGPVDVEGLSLARVLSGSDLEGGIVFAEAYTPDTLIALMENEDWEAIEALRCRLVRRAANRGDNKLITVGEQPDELFNVLDDSGELNNLIAEKPEETAELYELLKGFLAEAETRRPANWKASLRLGEEQRITDRLRGLGYVE